MARSCEAATRSDTWKLNHGDDVLCLRHMQQVASVQRTLESIGREKRSRPHSLASITMNCIFCQRDHSILAESDLSFAFLDNFAVSKGHTLVVPKRHVVTIWELTENEYADVFNLVRQVKDLIQNKFDPQGINIGVNCGEAAGQTVFHAHIHIIPRYTGDVANPRGGVRNIIPGRGDY